MKKDILYKIVGLIAIAFIGVGIYWWQRGDALPVQPPQDRESIVRNNATQALKAVADAANEISDITSGAVFTFEVADVDGRFANFGIVKYIDEVRGEPIVEEHAVTFREIGEGVSGSAEVDRDTHQVISMHRRVPDFTVGGDVLPADEIEARARKFVEQVEPNFSRFEPMLEFGSGSKDGKKGANRFFRWDDKTFALPERLEADIAPFIQVGITENGFIFGYDNTVSLYRSCKVWQSIDCIPLQ